MDNFIQSEIGKLQSVSFEVNLHFGKLSHAQLNWKPATEKWSIAQVLHHLIISNATYFPQLTAVAGGRHKNSVWQNVGFISRFMGKQMIKDLGPAKTRTFKNPGIFSPAQSGLPATIVADFMAHQVKLENHLQALQGINCYATVIYSPVSKLIIYSLHDAIVIITGHEQRHLIQAKEVLAHPAFPAA